MKLLNTILALVAAMLTVSSTAHAQSASADHSLDLKGSRTSAGYGGFVASKYAKDGSLYLLQDALNGIRIFKMDSLGATTLAEFHTGAKGDRPIAMTLDPGGNLYVVGTSQSEELAGTAGSAFSVTSVSSTNSFVAKFDANLKLKFLSFLGAGQTAVTGVAATSDSVFVTGTTDNPSLPVTSAGIQRTPLQGSRRNGFVERFATDGSKLIYATYLTGANGDTVPSAVVADSNNNAYVTGWTSATGFPTKAALQAGYLSTGDAVGSGFLTKLSPDGSTFIFSTYIAGEGMTGLALDAGKSLVLTGNVSPGQFPVASVAMPLTSTKYQTMLRISLDGQDVSSSTVLVPGSQSLVTPDAQGGTWISGSLTVPLFPADNVPSYAAGDGFLLHEDADGTLDQAFRFGGNLVNAAADASPMSNVGPPDSHADLVAVSGSVIETGGDAIGTQRFHPPNVVSDLVPALFECRATDDCSGAEPSPIVVSVSELDYGIVTAVDPPQTRTVTVSNLSSTAQTFISAQESISGNPLADWTETASTCDSSSGTRAHSIRADTSCTISIGLAAAREITADTPLRSIWKIGERNVILTGFVQVAALNLSSSRIDFGVQELGNGLKLPRYLYLSNNSTAAIAHEPAIISAGSTFTVTDHCPPMLGAHTVCRITLTYFSPTAPSADTATLSVDGFALPLSGTTLPRSAPSNTTDPALGVSSTSLIFSAPTIVTQISSSSQLLTVTNAGTVSLPFTFALSGDFSAASDCPSSLSPSTSCVLQITFAPSQPGVREGLVSLTSGSGFTPTYVSLTGTALPLLLPNSGTLAIGTTLIGEPAVAWYKLQQSLPSVTATTNNILFGVALVADTGSGHGSLPASAFHSSVTSNCNNCWLGVQFFSQAAGSSSALLTLTTNDAGSPYLLFLNAVANPVEGLLLAPEVQDFGSLQVGSSSAPFTFNLANLLAPDADVTVQSATTSGDFTLLTNYNGGAPCSGKLASTASCFIQVAFSPAAVGERKGVLTVVTDAGTLTAAMTGVGSQSSGLALSPTSLDFENVPGQAATRQSIVLSNTSSSTLVVGPVTSSNPSFVVQSNCSTLVAGATCNVAVSFTPGPATVAATLSITVTSATVTVYTVQLFGGYTVQDSGLQIVEDNLNFGSTALGEIGSVRQFNLNNLSGKPLNLTLQLPREFPLAIPAPCSSLPAGGSCAFSVNFVPITGGPLLGTVIARGSPIDGSAAVQALAYTLGYGAATRSLAISGIPIPNTPLGFGQVTSGSSSQLVISLSNSGTDSLTIRRITSQPPFLSTSSCGTPLAPGASCSVTLTYSPIYETLASAGSTPRSDTGLITIESDAITSPDTLLLTGTAVPIVSTNPSTSAVLSSLTFSQGALTFPNTQVGNVSAMQAVTITNAGTTTVHVTSWPVSTDFSVESTCGILLPGSSCAFNVRFTPTAISPSTARSGSLEILSDAGTSLDFVSLLGISTPAALTLSPASLDFGTVNVGGADSLNVTVSNISEMPVALTGLTTSGAYTATSNTCSANGGTLAAGASCLLKVSFAPIATGTQTGTLSLSSGAAELPLTVALTGIAVMGHLQVTPGVLAFGNTDEGFPAPLTLTLLNTGNASLTGIANTLSGQNTSDFAVTAPCSVTTLAPNQGCTETITFTPSAVGQRLATLNIASSDPSGAVTVALSGTGVEAGTFTLTVTGPSAASATVTGGSPATYPLVLTPKNGFTGQVALTCAPLAAGEYASCSLLAPTLLLGSTPQTSTATINTITSEVGRTVATLSGLLLLPFACRRKKREKRALRKLWPGAILILGITAISGCGGGAAPLTSNVRTTPPGTYRYQVTASSTVGAPVSSTVTLTLIVQ